MSISPAQSRAGDEVLDLVLGLSTNALASNVPH